MTDETKAPDQQWSGAFSCPRSGLLGERADRSTGTAADRSTGKQAGAAGRGGQGQAARGADGALAPTDRAQESNK